MHNVLTVNDLTKHYPAFSLKSVTFSVPTGYIMGFVGPNGAGKTTTIKAVLGMINYFSGDIKLFDKSRQDNAATINEQIGVVMDTPFYADDWTSVEVERAISPFYRQWNTGKFAELLKKFEIDRKKKIKALSRGMKVKLMMAAALSHDAKLLILDEPTSGLDPVARDVLCEIIGEFVSDADRSVLFSTHITSDLEKIADYITFILDGQIVFTGRKDELLEKFAAVKGGRNDINATHKKWIMGLREHATGFEGMAEITNIDKLPKGLLIEPVTLEEIIIYMNKGATLHA